MDAVVENLHLQGAASDPAQGGSGPELVVVLAAGVEADHQRGRADPVGQVLDIGRQIVAAGFLAGLDQDHAASVRDALVAQGEDGGEGPEHGVAVVGSPSAIQSPVAQHRLPRPQPFRPAGHLGLLV